MYKMLCGDISLPNVSYLQSRTNFTPHQLSEYVHSYIALSCGDSFAFLIVAHGLIISGTVGIISYILMLASLDQSKLILSPCTMIYHKAIIFFEFPHMVVMANYGLLVLYKNQFPQTYALTMWLEKLAYGWHLGDWSKLAVSTLTAFLTVERFVAVCIPAKFDRVNRNFVAYTAVGVSVFIGSAHIWAIFTKEIFWNEKVGLFESQDTWFGKSIFFRFITQFINVTKIFLCISIFILSVITIVKLKMQAGKISQMSLDAKQQWRSKRRVCTFSFVIGICILIDHLLWVAHKITSTYLAPLSIDPDTVVSSGQPFEEAMADVQYGKLVVATGHMQGWMGQAVHAWRFYIYLALNKTMRGGFRKAVMCRGRSNMVSSMQ